MEPRGEPAGSYGQDDIDLLNRALKLLADIPATCDVRITEALTSPFLGVKCREVVASAGRVHPDTFTGGEQELMVTAFGRACDLAGWPRVLEWAVQLTPILARVAGDPVAGPLRNSPGAWGAEGEWLFLDEMSVRFLQTIPPGEDWHAGDDGAGPFLQVDVWMFPLVPSGEVP